MTTIVLEPEAAATVIVDELDRDLEAQVNEAPPIASPTFCAAALDSAIPAQTSNNTRILTRLLSMADSYRESGSIRQAIEMYFELTREHAETPQGQRAEERLFEVARSYERSGELRQARGIYEQLL